MDFWFLQLIAFFKVSVMSEENAAAPTVVGEYEGDYQNGRYHGRGVYKYNGSVYEGNFVDGQFQGEGRLTNKYGSYQGYWNQGKLVDGGFVFSTMKSKMESRTVILCVM